MCTRISGECQWRQGPERACLPASMRNLTRRQNGWTTVGHGSWSGSAAAYMGDAAMSATSVNFLLAEPAILGSPWSLPLTFRVDVLPKAMFAHVRAAPTMEHASHVCHVRTQAMRTFITAPPSDRHFPRIEDPPSMLASDAPILSGQSACPPFRICFTLPSVRYLGVRRMPCTGYADQPILPAPSGIDAEQIPFHGGLFGADNCRRNCAWHNRRPEHHAHGPPSDASRRLRPRHRQSHGRLAHRRRLRPRTWNCR